MALSNVMTEAEAAGKWCPLARVPGYSPCQTGIAGLNSYGDGSPLPAASLCIGSRCMFWQWHDRGPRSNYETHHGPRPPDDRPDWIENSWEDDRTLVQVQEQENADREAGETPENIAITARRYHWVRPLEDLPPRGYCGATRGAAVP